MIKFTLRCEAEHEFEGWFRDNAAFEEQAGKGVLSCPVCGDGRVTKSIMAPAVRTSENAAAAQAEKNARMAAVMKQLRAAHEHVEKNFENVGERFAEEARAIHYGDKEQRDIFGQTTLQEAKELHDEGVSFGFLPPLPKADA
ncbi:DUF1178 family protein [Geminicoccus roseus]|uniref:DUF1178 family protein n=1 Tax=Geminicoccus roseus TaxID=404900 RepID=UPI0003F99C61|nr:DUF1178 family protein [Geminicoccus roseus]